MKVKFSTVQRSRTNLAGTITPSATNEEIVASDPTSLAKPPKTQERVLESCRRFVIPPPHYHTMAAANS